MHTFKQTDNKTNIQVIIFIYHHPLHSPKITPHTINTQAIEKEFDDDVTMTDIENTRRTDLE